MNLSEIKKQCLVVDIETSSHFHSGASVDIKSDFDTYVLMAQCKWFGAYSYKYNKYFNLNVNTHRSVVLSLLKSHKYLVGFNIEDFDYPVLLNNHLTHEDDKHIIVDCMSILGKSKYKNKSGYPYKDRGSLMDYDFKKNSLRYMAEKMNLETQKGDIDYKIFRR